MSRLPQQKLTKSTSILAKSLLDQRQGSCRDFLDQ